MFLLNSFLSLPWLVRALYSMCLYVYMWGGVGLYGGVIAATGVKPGVTDAQRSVVQQLQ